MSAKKITLKNKSKSVSATFEDEESLSDVLIIVDGLIKALGYCYDGTLGVVDDVAL